MDFQESASSGVALTGWFEEPPLGALQPQIRALVQRVASLAQRRSVVEIGVRVPRQLSRAVVVEALQDALRGAGFGEVTVVTSIGEGGLELEVIEFDR